MKICTRPWDYLYVIDAENGQVWPCSWLNMRGSEHCLGNLLEQDVEEIFESDRAKEFRESILDGSYRYCSVQECCFLSNDWLPEISEKEFNELIASSVPTKFNLAYDETCNHACPSCRNECFKGSKEYYDKVDTIGEKLLPFLNNATYVSANGRGDLFACEHILQLLERLNPNREDFVFLIETNASLFDAAHFKRIEHLSKFSIKVTATVNSFVDSTYRYLNGFANHVDKVIDNLRYMKGLREKGQIKKLTLSMVVQESNFRELPEWTRRCFEEFGADNVRIRGIMQFSMDENEFWYKDVFNPAHPFYSEVLEILKDPIFKDERVWFWEGDYTSVRKPRELPSKRFELNYNLLWKLTQLYDKQMLDDIFDDYKTERIALYGAGKLAEYLIDHVNSVKFVKVFDGFKKEAKLACYPIVKLESDSCIDDVDLVINTVPFYKEELNELLNSIGYCGKVISLEDMFKE